MPDSWVPAVLEKSYIHHTELPCSPLLSPGGAGIPGFSLLYTDAPGTCDTLGWRPPGRRRDPRDSLAVFKDYG